MPKKLTTEDFIEKAKEIFPNLDYSDVIYINNKTKISLYCPEHDCRFLITPNMLLQQKIGCKYCSGHKIDYRKKCTEKFGNKFDYSLVDFEKNRYAKQTFICKKHGKFESSLFKFLKSKHGCIKCSGKYQYTTKEWREMVTELRGEEYDYTLANYIRCDLKVEIICKKCGKHFWQLPENHISNLLGCPYCKKYKLEEEIKRYLDKNKINYERNFSFDDLRDTNLLSYDFYIKNHNTLIECNGIQHYKFNSFFHRNLRDFHKQLHHDWLKRKYARKNGIKLIIIPYTLKKAALSSLMNFSN